MSPVILQPCNRIIYLTKIFIPLSFYVSFTSSFFRFILRYLISDLLMFFSFFVGRDIVVGIATCYGMDGPGIESRWEAKVSTPVQPGPGAHSASCTMSTGSFPGVKRSGRGVDHPPPSSAEGKERVQLYFYSPSGPSWPVLGWIFLSLFYFSY